ncbi:uracil permease-like [Lecanosticta acicola]|uniref:Uracil permease-like n=1 Tax=Lecanosticta acicola TaxID=111012 RepID=A0AAI8Z2G0_9PEZI|nr:uracil permease-like [Lecanosticta acicola]
MSAEKRGRACTACASIKIKCQLGSDVNLQPPCERCVRLSKECVLSQPKRQKDRVAELEAQVASLTRLLQAQGIQDPSISSGLDTSSDTTPPSSSTRSPGTASKANSVGKKRRLYAAHDRGNSSTSPTLPRGIENDISKLDQLLSWETQERVLVRYVNEVFPTFPAVPLPADCTLHYLRVEKPLLLLAVIYAGSTAIVALDAQESIAAMVFARLVEVAVSKEDRNLETLQAIQIVCLWYRSPKQHNHLALNQLIQFACGPREVNIREERYEESIDCWRASLVCYHLAASGTIFTRCPNIMKQWDKHHDQCVFYLDQSPYALPTDLWLGKLFRAERLCEQIATTLELNNLDTFLDISDAAVRTKISLCRDHLLNWKVQTPQSTRNPMLYFWENLALAYMHEPVLHTANNKHTFTAPYVSDRLSITDFPAPVVTEQHITAVYELLSALQSIVETLSNWSTTELLGQSGLMVSSRATYAHYVLAKLYVAVTAPGNTLGSIIDPALLRYEEYSDKLIATASRVAAVDNRCSPSRILGAAPKLREWVDNYKSSLSATEPAVVANVPPMATDLDAVLQLGDDNSPSYSIAACFVCMTGRIGAKYHISFPVVCRSSFGIWGSLWPVLNRAGMACVWYGVQGWIGGTCVYLMIRSIWPSWDSYGPDGSHNTLPASSGTNTRDFVSFFLFWLGSLPFLWFPVQKIRHLFTVKAYFVPAAGIAFFIWAIVRANGIGPIVKQGSTLQGSALAWAIVKGIMAAIANFATLIVNDPDFARFARKPRDALWPQLLTIPIGFAVTSFIGIIVSSSSVVIFPPEPIWSPLTLLQKFLDEPGVGSGARFGVFVIAAAFTLAQLGTNIAANSISAGTDMTALLPRWINIRRGSYICAAVGIAMCPWNLLSNSNNFTTYLSAYSVFLSSIAGVIVCDYYLVRKGYLQTRDLYSALKNGPYYYTWGVSWRAYAAYIAGILINVVGFAGAVGTPVPRGATYIYNLNFFCGFLVAAIMYYGLCWFWPIPATSPTGKWMEVDEDVTGRNNSLVYGDDVERHSVESVDAGKLDLPKSAGA